MNEKTTVTVVAPDGYTQTFKGETVIMFTIDKIEEFLDDKVKQMDANTVYVGNEPPEYIFDELIARLVGSLVEKDNEENPIKASFILFNIANRLIARSDQLRSNATKEQVDAFVEEAMNELSDALKAVVGESEGGVAGGSTDE